MSTRTKLLAPLVVWTLFVWTSRLRNVWMDDDLGLSGQVIRTVMAAVFLAFGLATARLLRVQRRRALESRHRMLVGGFIAWTIGFWLVRGVGIIVDDHTLGFTVVHTILMVISIALAGLATRALVPDPDRRPAMIG